MSTSAAIDREVTALAARLAGGEEVGDGALQALLAAAVRRYAARRAAGPLAAWPREFAVPATDVVVTVMAMLDASEIAVFELGMWQALGRT